jgi:hypothetical protein
MKGIMNNVGKMENPAPNPSLMIPYVMMPTIVFQNAANKTVTTNVVVRLCVGLRVLGMSQFASSMSAGCDDEDALAACPVKLEAANEELRTSLEAFAEPEIELERLLGNRGLSMIPRPTSKNITGRSVPM